MTLLGHLRSVMAVAWSPCGLRIASGSSDLTVKIWNSTTGVCTMTLNEHTNKVKSVAWSPDST